MAASKRQTTRAKMDREQAVRDKRARKQQKRDDKKHAQSAPGVAAEETDSQPGVAEQRPAG